MQVTFQTAIGLGSVALPATAGQYVQLPAVACDAIGFGKTSGDIRLATSASPGSNYLLLNTAASGNASNASPAIPTGGDSSNLWVANDTATAQTIGFLWLRKAPQPTYPAC
jgi:hypothetical protein